MQGLLLANRLFPRVESGDKRLTVRQGHRPIELGPLELKSAEPVGDERIKKIVNVTRVIYTLLKNVTDKEARQDGFLGQADLATGLRSFYPEITDNDEVTLVYWDPTT